MIRVGFTEELKYFLWQKVKNDGSFCLLNIWFSAVQMVRDEYYEQDREARAEREVSEGYGS